jgi:hypothetical protein
MWTSVSPWLSALSTAQAAEVKRALIEEHLPGRLGEAVQIKPMKSKLKAPRTKHLQLKYDNLLSNFAFEFNLRRYSWGRLKRSLRRPAG